MAQIVSVPTVGPMILLLLVMLLGVMLLMRLMLVLLRQVHLQIVPLVTRPPIEHHMLALLMSLVVHAERIVCRRRDGRPSRRRGVVVISHTPAVDW